MANKDIYILFRAKDFASKTIGKINKEIGKLGKVGGIASRGVSTLATNLVRLGAVAAVGLGAAVKMGIDNLEELESATSAVQGAITQMGLTGQVTAGQIVGWANEIEDAVGAAFDEKPIALAAANLIRYGSVTTPNLRKAMEVMTDLAAKTGDVESASTLLGKALADPTKAAGKLSRMGIVLTKVEQDQIKAMVKAGKTAQAQALLLDLLARKTEGAALASQGPYKRAQAELADATEHATMALSEGLLPVIQEVATMLRSELVKPSTMQSIRDFGQGLAGGLREAVKWAKSLPWDTIVSGLKAAAGFAKGLIDAFASMPKEVQALIIGLAGLNKLTGGAVSGIIGELGKGLIKGVLGMNAGVVNINAAVVNGVGGVGGVAGAAAGGGIGGKIAALGATLTSLPVLIGAAVVAGSTFAANELVNLPMLQGQAETNIASATVQLKEGSLDELKTALSGLQDIPNHLDLVEKLLYDNNAYGVKTHNETMQQAYAAEINRRQGQTGLEAILGPMGTTINRNLDTMKLAATGQVGLLRSSLAAQAGTKAIMSTVAAASNRTATITAATKAATSTGLAAVRAAVAATAAAIRAKKMSVTVNSSVSVRSYMNGKVVVDAYTGRKRAP